ncbi:dipeptide ABC transporter ATP-binding protein [Ensifer sp. T173]|uniref:Dipeptide ABC transporter ATP-binding protein n=1 Tax=Ensifer canadensis TaxID=555315 RepID=A0AAW4FVA0_9HYPH|nr:MULTISPECIES: ABC transporter ATP-binding protein [Ensifer]KQU88140.1 hypothetical protein ASD00_29495 [Ensifer sp. Root31]MBM3095205.1 dipeptide ABC transporter ATP-binding protein [Ensifer canadensis]UBI80095.1 ABC transporter ATP-binding protein [Ensifer canadensis]
MNVAPNHLSAPAGETQVALQVEGLRVDVVGSKINIVAEVNFSLRPGEIMGLVGESGSGKTTAALALLGYAKIGTAITAGSVRIRGVDLLPLPWQEIRRQRGRLISYVPQDPGASLNPAMRIGAQMLEALNKDGKDPEATGRMAQALADVALPATLEFLRRFPHQLSGGQQQRVGLAMAFIGRPAVVVLDEPTTGLDVTTQAHVLATVRDLCARYGTAAVYVSHDLAVVNDLADSVAVMYLGRIVESGPTHLTLRSPEHPYTRLLISAIPDPLVRRKLRGIAGHAPSVASRDGGCVFASRCPDVLDSCRRSEPPLLRLHSDGHKVACLRRQTTDDTVPFRVPDIEAAAERAEKPVLLGVSGLDAGYGTVRILKGLDLEIRQGLCTAIVGESGSGKTTLAKCLGGLHTDAKGSLQLHGETLPFGTRRRSTEQRRAVQYIFQNPYSSLNPRRTVHELIAQSIAAFTEKGRAPRQSVADLLSMVALNPRLHDRYPQQLSGGERQRVAIARAIAADPEILICDEITSALDVSVQASIVQLLKTLHRQSGTTIVFITHNLAVVRAIADRVAVVKSGVLVEEGPSDAVLDAPQDAYTQNLLQSTPRLWWS